MESSYQEFSNHVTEDFKNYSKKSVKGNTCFLIKFIREHVALQNFNPGQLSNDFHLVLMNYDIRSLNLDEKIKESATMEDINYIHDFLSGFLHPQHIILLKNAFHADPRNGIDSWREFIRLLCMCLEPVQDNEYSYN